MRKVNWVKVSKNAAVNTSALWHHSAKGAMELPVRINPVVVEELFARAEVKKSAKGKEDEGGAKKKQSSVVSVIITCQATFTFEVRVCIY